jgi:ditrans,polycis-polyprenyl diphosphate synthase
MEKMALHILDRGEIPGHIAIIMDGNRRFARKKGFDRIGEGHRMGGEKLKEVIRWLSILHGVKMLTVYAFSILNFKRSQQEVEELMDLAMSFFSEIRSQQSDIQMQGAALRFIGRKELLSERMQIEMNELEAAAPENPKFVLNICVSYTSHDEIERARDRCKKENGDMTLDSVFQKLDLPCRPDLLIRTSGVWRMSNFLLMQCAETPIAVVDSLWPELSAWDLVKILLKYQLRKVLPYHI